MPSKGFKMTRTLSVGGRFWYGLVASWRVNVGNELWLSSLRVPWSNTSKFLFHFWSWYCSWTFTISNIHKTFLHSLFVFFPFRFLKYRIKQKLFSNFFQIVTSDDILGWKIWRPKSRCMVMRRYSLCFARCKCLA